MASLNFQMSLDNEAPKASSQGQFQPAQPQEAGGLSGLLKRSSHPIAIIFHYLFKSLALLCFFFLNIFSNATITFIIVVIFSAFDFWTVQNITGRLLVGLRWRNRINEDGSEEWIFESLNDKSQSNKIDVYAFWLGLVAAPLTWSILLLAYLLTFDFFWSMVALICLVLTGINMVGYYKCNKDSKQKLSGMLKQGAFMAASQALKV
ncbi:unnamed protein product [Blepharisma stoltei]|uniref:Golgi apparatus membrane protein TVP23 homolog n=1 Tax=Blepharisma stoltei TaxID=1481888 RepID=A0AAU9JNA1_9CILI|nr:unnamed protein product [Blepharisma stoltei]